MLSRSTKRIDRLAMYAGILIALLIAAIQVPNAAAQEQPQPQPQPTKQTAPPRRAPGTKPPLTTGPSQPAPKGAPNAPGTPTPTPPPAGQEQPAQQPKPGVPAQQPSAQPAQQPAPQPVRPPTPPTGQDGGQPVGRDETGRVKIDPDLQKKIDQMLQDDPSRRPGDQTANPPPTPTPPAPTPPAMPAGQTPPPAAAAQDAQKAAAQRAADRRRTTPGNPPRPPGGQPGVPQPEGGQPADVGGAGAQDSGLSTEIEIAPDPNLSATPPEQRQYSFSIKNGTYEQLIKGFAHQTGLGVLGEAPRDGTVTFETTETLSFSAALSRIRMLLFNYKPLEPYWVFHEGTHLRVIRVTDFYRILPLDHMFRSVSDLEAANLPDDEIVLVIYTPQTGSIADLRQVRDFLPDYVRVTPLDTGNSVLIFALVSDIKKYLELIKFFPKGSEDPRTIERFDVQFITPTEAVNRLRLLTDLDSGGRAPAPAGVRRGAQAQPNPLDQMSEPPVGLIPDDAQGYILVRAMKDKIEEIRKLLPYIDVDTSSGEFRPVVIPIEHADVLEVVTAIQQVLSASVSPAAAPVGQPAAPRGGVAPKGRRRGAAAVGQGGPVATDAVTMIPHPSKNAIVVIGDDAGVAKVRDLVVLFDVSSSVGPVRIQLEVADAGEVVSTVTQVLGVVGAKGQPAVDKFQLVPDPSGGSLWYSGSEKELAKVRDLVAALDVPGEPLSLHTVRLIYKMPSFVAGVLKELDGSTAAAPAPAAAGRKPKTQRVAIQAASKFTPDDAQKLLYLLCTDTDWRRYEALLAQIDKPVVDEEPFIRLTVHNVDPNTVIERLGPLCLAAGLDTSVRMVANDGKILVMNATPTDLDKLKVLVAEVDKPSLIEQRIFEIHHADPADIKVAIETLLGGASPQPRTPARRRTVRAEPGKPPAQPPTPAQVQAQAAAPAAADATASDEMTILQMGNRLVVKASPQRLEEVAAIIAEFDVESAATELKVYSDFPPGSDIAGISETLLSVFGDASRPGRPAGKDGPAARIGSGGPRFIPQPASGRLVVIADPSQFAEIERLLKVLRVEASAEPSIVEFVEVKYADPTDLVEEIKPLLEIRVRGLLESGELTEPAADNAAPTNVPRPGRVKALQKGATQERYHVAADARNERIVIAAPRAIIDEAKRLIALFDQPGKKKDKPVFRKVELANASPAEMVKTVKEMMGRTTARRPGVRGKPAAGGAQPGAAPGAVPGAAVPEGLSTDNLSIFEAPGGGAIVLNGAEADVEQAAEWIKQLDAMSTRGRSIKLYEVHGAEIAQVFDLIINVVDSAAPAKGAAPAAVRPPAFGKAAAKESKDEDEFATTKTYSGADLYIQADLIGKTMLVATTPSKMAQIDDIVKMFETDEILAEATKKPPIPKFMYRLDYASATDAKFDLRDLLESLWEPHDELPKVDKLFKDTLVVRYPDESRFDEIRKLIREQIDTPTEKKTKRISRPVPEGMSAQATARWLQLNMPGYAIDMVDKTPEAKKFPTIEEVGPPQTPDAPKPAPCVMPTAFGRMAATILSAASAQAQQQPPPDEHAEEVEPAPDDQPVIEQPIVQPPQNSDAMIRQAMQSVLTNQATGEKGKKSGDKGDEKLPHDNKAKQKTSKNIKLYVDDSQGVVVIEGEEDDLDAVKDSMDQLKDEIKDYKVVPDIRILRVKYIDVYTAQDIIEEMFNATKSQQAAFNVQQQQMQQQMQMQRVQQMQQQRLQQQQPGGRGQQPGQDNKGAPAVPGQPGQQPQLQQPQFQMPQLPAPAVRVYPNPRDRTLILRAETSQYPQIYEMLAKIDQPKPIDSIMRTFQLKKLNAAEVEQMLREMLRLDEGKSRPKAAPARAPGMPGMPGAASASATGPGGQLPQTVLQQSVTGSLLGVDPQDITIFSSETANAIMVMAPPAALDYIGKLIEQFESGNMAERVTRYYELKYAEVADVAEQLTSYFNEKSPGAAGRGGRKAVAAGAGAGTPGGGVGLNAPSFISYDRLNMLTVHATGEQFKEIEEELARLDVKSAEDDWKDVVLAHADAKQVADTLTDMFGGGSAPRGGPRGPIGGPAGGAKSGGGPKFIGEAGGRIVLYSAPKNLHEQIIATIAKLEAQSKQTTTPRIIELKNATPSQLADAIEKAYDTKRAGPKGAATAAPRFTVTAHDPSHRLFFVGDDEMFAQIQSLVATLDTPGSTGPSMEFRIYPLKYANAKAVHSQLTKLMTEYVQRLGPDPSKKIEAFSVQPDETANALIVLGSPSIFGFIEENLRKIDTPGAAVGQQEVHVVDVKNADPDALVKTLSDIFVRTATKTQDGDVPISISSATGSKALVVKCNTVDFAKIDATIKELDTQEATTGETRVVPLLYGDAAEVNTALQEYLKKPGAAGGRGGQLIGDVRLGVLAQTNAIMVSGDKEQIARIEGIIRGMDIAGEKGSVPQIIALKYASASLVLPSLKEMFSDPKMGAGRKNYSPPVIVADELGNNIIVRGSPQDFAAIQGVVDKLDTEDKQGKSAVRIVQVAPGINVEDLADKVQQSINESAKLRGGGGARGAGAQTPGILATADKRTNSITLAGSTMLFDQAENMIKALEKMGPSGNQVTAIIPVTNIRTDDIRRLIDQMTQQGSSGGARRSSGGGAAPRPPPRAGVRP